EIRVKQRGRTQSSLPKKRKKGTRKWLCAHPAGQRRSCGKICGARPRPFSFAGCSDKDCLEDLRVYFTQDKNDLIANATNVRLRSVDVVTVYLDLESVPFNKGF